MRLIGSLLSFRSSFSSPSSTSIQTSLSLSNQLRSFNSISISNLISSQYLKNPLLKNSISPFYGSSSSRLFQQINGREKLGLFQPQCQYFGSLSNNGNSLISLNVNRMFPLSSLTSSSSSLLTRSIYVEKLKKYKPTSPGMRWRKIVDTSHLWRGGPVKSLTVALRKSGGRNNRGRITVRHRGGGHKRRYRIIDFKRLGDTECIVERLEYDPNRTSWIALLKNIKTSKHSYIICPKGLEVGQTLTTGKNAEIKNGNSLYLKNIPVGTLIHNIELVPGKGGQLARSAGAYAQLLKTNATGYATIKLSSGESRLISVESRATIGVVSNTLHKHVVLGKAGASRWKGRRSSVRGVAMNPVDHPHGGGEGKGGEGGPPVSPWGKLAKSKKKTRQKHKYTNKFIVQTRDAAKRK